MTGFRLARGGAQERYNISPDITTLGKIIGGGLPVGAYGGSREIMNHIAPAGPTYQAGTLSGNPLSMTAGLITLRRLRDKSVYEILEAASNKLCEGLANAAREAGVTTVTNRVGSMWTSFESAMASSFTRCWMKVFISRRRNLRLRLSASRIRMKLSSKL
jgi:glutamate-1-semialdehyde 2,1-aminomutase